METGFRVLRAEIKRSVIEKAFAICLSLCSWGIAIGSVYTTVLVAFGRLEAGSRAVTFPFSDLFPPSVLFVVLPTHPIRRQVGSGWKDHRLTGWMGFLAPRHVPLASRLAAADSFHLVSRC